LLEKELPVKVPVKESLIPALINRAVAQINAVRKAADARDWTTAVNNAEKAVEAARLAEEAAGAPIPNQKYPSITLLAQAKSHYEGAQIQSYAAAQTSPAGYASGGYENAGDFGYGAGVF